MNKKAIVSLASSWGPQNGGINALNTDLCISLAKGIVDNIFVCCIVLTAQKEQIRNALENNVHLLNLDIDGDQSEFHVHHAHQAVSILTTSGFNEILWWIGHDVKTGFAALKCRELFKNSKCAILHHMDYSAYKAMEPGNTEPKIRAQRQVLSVADIVFAVGPKLAKSARDKVAHKASLPVVELIPGLASIEGLPTPARFSAVTFGRLNPHTDRVKQARLAVAAFASARGANYNQLEQDARLTVIGLSKEQQPEEHHQLLKLGEEIGKCSVQIHGWAYMDNREALFDHLRRYSVCLMLSLHEGFGLVGWEAISAEVPLIVSRNSGLYEAVDNLLGGMGTGCLRVVDIRGSHGTESYRPEDVEDVANAIIAVHKRTEKAKNDAISLKKLLSQVCSWEYTASVVAENCKIPFQDSPKSLNLSRWQPHLLLDALQKSKEMVDLAARRKVLYQHLWDMLNTPGRVEKRIVIFGGVATSLCNSDAAIKYAKWLTNNQNAKLFVCYESGSAAEARARLLSNDKLDTSAGLSDIPKQRMKEKEDRIIQLKANILELFEKNERESLSKRIIFIPLTEPLTTYIIIVDEDIFITPLFESRSSETLSFALSNNPIWFKRDVLRFIIYYISNIGLDENSNKLNSELDNILNDIKEKA